MYSQRRKANSPDGTQRISVYKLRRLRFAEEFDPQVAFDCKFAPDILEVVSTLPSPRHRVQGWECTFRKYRILDSRQDK